MSDELKPCPYDNMVGFTCHSKALRAENDKLKEENERLKLKLTATENVLAIRNQAVNEYFEKLKIAREALEMYAVSDYKDHKCLTDNYGNCGTCDRYKDGWTARKALEEIK